MISWFTHFAGLNCPSSSKITQEKLKWSPTQTTLIADIDRDSYFKV